MIARFQELQQAIRAVSARAPDHSGWTEACRLLDEIDDADVRAHAAELEVEVAAWAPDVRRASPGWAARLVAQGQEPRVRLCRALDLHFITHRGDLWRALDAPDAAGIDRLGISYCDLDAAAAPDLARRLARIGVAWLDLTGNPIGAGIAHVLRLSRDGALTSLRAESCGLGRGVFASLLTDGVVIGLRKLGLAVNHLDAKDIECLVRLPGLEALDSLSLGGNSFLAAGVRILAERAPLPMLRELDLEGTQCGDDGAALLVASPAFAKLEAMSVASCRLTDAGAAALAATTSLAALRDLDLRFNRITAAGARSLLTAHQLTALTQLRLDGNEIGDEIVDVLAAGLPARLARLTLDDLYLGEEARAALQALPVAQGVLELLSLRDAGP